MKSSEDHGGATSRSEVAVVGCCNWAFLGYWQWYDDGGSEVCSSLRNLPKIYPQQRRDPPNLPKTTTQNQIEIANSKSPPKVKSKLEKKKKKNVQRRRRKKKENEKKKEREDSVKKKERVGMCLKVGGAGWVGVK